MSRAGPNGFDRLAGSYDLLARVFFGNAIRKSQTCFLPLLPKEAEVLVIGGGSGWFLEQLLAETACRRVAYVDASGAMLDRARSRIRNARPEFLPRVRFIHGDWESIPEDSRYDVVVTHCFLDLFTAPSLHPIVACLAAHLGPDGVWYFSDFRAAEGRLSAPLSRGLLAVMYAFFRRACRIDARALPPFDEAFRRAGLAQVREARFHSGMLQALLLAPDARSR